MITALALTLLTAAGSVDDITPVSSAIVEIVMADPATGGPLCDAYRQVVVSVEALTSDPAAQQVFLDATDAYAIIMLEGDSMRLDNGARDTLTNWLHSSCS